LIADWPGSSFQYPLALKQRQAGWLPLLLEAKGLAIYRAAMK
jgi:hypothetical protein